MIIYQKILKKLKTFNNKNNIKKKVKVNIISKFYKICNKFLVKTNNLIKIFL